MTGSSARRVEWRRRGGKNTDNTESSSGRENTTNFLSTRRFTNSDVKGMLSEATLRALHEQFGHEHLSKVQAYTFDTLMSGADVFVKSKTGSGKTMAFLLPAVEASYTSVRNSGGRAHTQVHANSKGLAHVHSIVISPTKELASQTFTEVRKLMTYAPHGIRAALVIGGNDRKSDVRTLSASHPGGGGDISVLVATPGRLQDYVKTLPGFREGVMPHIRTIILDEADRMLDAGFRAPLEAILDAAPRVGSRQTVLVSATMPSDVLSLSKKYMRPDMAIIDIARGGEVVTGEAALSKAAADDEEDRKSVPAVNPAVSHTALIAPHSVIPHVLLQALCDHAESRPAFKIIVFLPFKKQVNFMAEVLRRTFRENDCMGSETHLLEIHSDLQQSQRDRASDTFRNASRAVLLGTDVIARGVDYPDVSFVIQMGVTDRMTYVHRVGRTGRAGRKGEALILLAPFEEPVMRTRLQDYGVLWRRVDDPEKSRAQNARAQTRKGLPEAETVQVAVRPGFHEAMKKMWIERGGANYYDKVYYGWLGFYGSESKSMGVSKPHLKDKEAPEAYRAFGMEKIPRDNEKMLKKMGYR